MKKNLFLTLALLLASLVGVNAQDWCITLSGDQGLPGFNANKGVGVENLKTYKSSVIRPGKAIDGFRYTVITTEYEERPNGNAPLFMLSEFAIYDLNGNKLNYTVTSNADHNTITGTPDGGGLPALSDGSYTTFFHSNWGTPAVADYHYLEFTLEAPVEEFIVEWSARHNKQYLPTVVGLTEKGVTYVPYADLDYTFGDKLTSLEAVKAAQFVTIQGNADTLYTVYNHETGNIATEKVDGVDVPQVDKKGPGKLFFAGNNKKAAEADVTFTAQLIPTEDGDGSVYVYFPYVKRYVNANATDNGFGAEAQNGWQTTTALKSKAAKVFLTPVDGGDFEMWYNADVDGAVYKTYIGADPRGNFKVFSEARKEALEAKGWCQAFGIKCYFNFSFFDTKYTAPTWDGEFLLGYSYQYAKSLYDLLGNEIFEDEDGLNAEALENFEAALPAAWETVLANEGLKYDDYATMVTELNDCLGRFVEAKVSTAFETVAAQMKDYEISATPKQDAYPESAYNEFIDTNIIIAGRNLWNRGEEENPYDYIDELLTYLNSIQGNIDSFLASKYNILTLPAFFGEKVDGMQGTPLGTDQNGQRVWNQEVNLNKAVNGFRLTFLANNNGQLQNNFPMIALAELSVVNPEGQALALDETLVTTNSEEDLEHEAGNGTIAMMLDGKNDTYYHSSWGGGHYDPVTYVYLDVKFPEGVSLSSFTLNITSRREALSPAYVAMTEYGQAFDPKLNLPNTYNVKAGKKITDPAQLVDGGLYLISGNLRVNKEENPAEPRFYSGVEPYHTSIVAAENDATVYMLKKAGDGWNIISLSKGMYWTEAAGLTAVQSEAAVIKIVQSGNIEGAMALYSDIEPETLEAGFSLKAADGETDSVLVETQEITVSKRVYMDWDGGLAQRPCQSELPGVFEYGFDVLKDHPALINESSFGDYVHFNKTNGEGEWNIQEVSMDDPYYRWLLAYVANVENLGVVPGTDPGCVIADAAVETAYNTAKAAADAAVAAEEKANAETLVNDLVAAVNSLMGLETVKIDSKKYYTIQSALPAFNNREDGKRAGIYVDAVNGKLVWGETPAISWETAEHVFQLMFLDEEKQMEFDIYPTGAEAPYAYIIYNEKTGTYVTTANDTYDPVHVSTDPTQASVFVIKAGKGNEFTIQQSGNSWNQLHAANSGYGLSGSDVRFWGSGVGTASGWYICLVDEEATSISDLVVEGDEVVSVSYFTPAGAATATPVKGINIVVIVYNNGVVETKKVLVK